MFFRAIVLLFCAALVTSTAAPAAWAQGQESPAKKKTAPKGSGGSGSQGSGATGERGTGSY